MTHTAASIRKLLQSPKAVRRAILRLYTFQTEGEKEVGISKSRNGKGFNRPDSFVCSKVAEKFMKNEKLSSFEWRQAIKLVDKYAGQLARYANERSAENDAKKNAQLLAGLRRHLLVSQPYARFA